MKNIDDIKNTGWVKWSIWLKFNWAARANSALSTNGILVIVNRQLLKNIVPVDYALNTENLEFFINSNVA